jgi:hypothetical protein
MENQDKHIEAAIAIDEAQKPKPPKKDRKRPEPKETKPKLSRPIKKAAERSRIVLRIRKNKIKEPTTIELNENTNI